MRVLRYLSGFAVTLVAILAPSIFAAMPATSTYQLNSYGFGSGGTAGSSTPTYSLEGITGEVSGQSASTTTYTTKPGFNESQQANVPTVTLTNPSNYYDKLKFVISQQGNPTDAKYALKIETTSTTCASPTATYYVKSDLTIGVSLTVADYQTYATWGGAGGANIIGLTSNTTYCLYAKATQGNFTESGYGPSSSAATVGQQLSYCICSGTTQALGALLPGSVTTSSNIGIDFATNANSGGNVYVYSANGGLRSTHALYTLASATDDLSSAASGFGAQITAISQTTGGPLSKVSPYNGASNNVGILSTSVNTILSSTAPLTGGSATIQLQAKSTNTTPAGQDYAETLTMIAAAAF